MMVEERRTLWKELESTREFLAKFSCSVPALADLVIALRFGYHQR
jgi:hypothetical protein